MFHFLLQIWFRVWFNSMGTRQVSKGDLAVDVYAAQCPDSGLSKLLLLVHV